MKSRGNFLSTIEVAYDFGKMDRFISFGIIREE